MPPTSFPPPPGPPPPPSPPRPPSLPPPPRGGSVPPPGWRPSEPPPGDGASALTRFGSAVGAALVASAFATVPAALRVGASTPDVQGVWVALVAATLVPMIFAVVLLRRARVGLRAFGGPGAQERALAGALWLGGVLFFSAVFGAALRATTHHHALAGATFALGTLVAAIGLLPIALRVARVLSRWREEGRTGRLLALGALAMLCVPLVVVRLARALPAGGPLEGAASATLIDVLAFGMCALLASRPEFTARRVLSLFGPPAAAVVFVFGWRALVVSPPLGAALADRAPAFGAAADAASDLRH